MRKVAITLLIIFLLCILYFNVTQAYSEVTISLSDGSTYGVTLLETDELTYTYHVREISGKDLSHFVFGIELCVNKEAVVLGTDGYILGKDPTTEIDGIKWNTESDFTEGDFSFTLDNIYPTEFITVAVKAGTMVNYGQIEGPSCIEPVPTGTNTRRPTATATVTNTVVEEPTATETVTPTEFPVHTQTPTETFTPVFAPPLPHGTPTPTATLGVPKNEPEVNEPLNRKFFLPLLRK